MVDNAPNSNSKGKFKEFLIFVLIRAFLIFQIKELLGYNGRLRKCSEIINLRNLKKPEESNVIMARIRGILTLFRGVVNLRDKGNKLDVFLLQIVRTQRVVVLTVLPFVLASIYHYIQYYEVRLSFSYLKLLNATIRGNSEELLVTLNTYPSVIISLCFTVGIYIVMQIYLWRFISNYEIRNKTKELCSLAKRINIIDEELESKCLWTSAGILMELKTSTATELVKNTTFWGQLDMEPASILYPKKEKRVFFIMSGFELADEYDFTIKD